MSYVAGNVEFGEDFPNVMEWTTEPPTKEGWYWATENGGVTMIEVYEGHLAEATFDYWLGPLPEPVAPSQ